MVFHVGIDPFLGEVSYCNKYEKIIVNIKIKNNVRNDEIEKVSLMFEEIKSKINGKIGYACMSLYGKYYGNEIRKKFIECGLKSGFKNVEIINAETALYLSAISQIKFKTLNGNVIWIQNSDFFFVWEINNQKAKFCGMWKADASKLYELQKIVDESNLNKGPDVVLSDTKIDESNLRRISECQCYLYSYYSSKGCLLKAQKTAGDSELAHLETFEFLSDKISLNVDDEEITTFEKYQLLPITFSLKLKNSFRQISVIVRTYTKEDINIPDENNIKAVFKVDMNGIYHVNFSSAKKFLLPYRNNVIMYDYETQNLTIFPASIDYGFGGKKVGVEYNSPTVIKEVMKYFGGMSIGNSIPLREIYYLNEIKRFYVLKFGHNKRLIEEGRVIVDLIDEAINRSELSKDSITLIIPFNFSEIQRQNYLKAVEVAGLTNISFIDEQTALAFGYEDKYDAIHGIEYLLINNSDTFTKITLNKAGEFDKENCLQKTIDSENFDLSKLTFFDNIINSAKGNNTEIVDFGLHLQNLFNAVNELITNATNLTTIVVSNEIPYAFLQDYFPNFSIIVLEDCEKLIVKGAALA